MRKVLLLLLIVFLGIGLAYAAPRKVKTKTREAKIVEQCDPQKDPNCSSEENVAKTEKTCGKGGRALKVAGMIGNAPFGWVEADQGTRQNMQSYGLGRIVLEKIIPDLGIRFVSVGYPSQEETMRALRKGEIDLMLGVYHRGDLGTEVEIVTPSYFTNYFTVYFKKGHELPIESYQDLTGLKGVVRKEELFYPLIYRRLPDKVQIQEVISSSKAFTMLMNEEVDYILGSPYAIEGELRRYKMQNDIVSDGVVLDSATLFFAISKNSPCYALKDDISSLIRQYGFSQKTLDKDIRKLINDWGNRFRSDEVLVKTKENTLPENMNVSKNGKKENE